MSDKVLCELCGEPMPENEFMFKFHGYSGSCPKPPKQQEKVVNNAAINLLKDCLKQSERECENLRRDLADEQQKRVEAETEAEKRWSLARQQQDRIAQLEADMAALRSALEFYAKEENWQEQNPPDPWNGSAYYVPVIEDEGFKAKDMLAIPNPGQRYLDIERAAKGVGADLMGNADSRLCGLSYIMIEKVRIDALLTALAACREGGAK